MSKRQTQLGLKNKLKEKGYTVNNVEISVGTDYSAVGEGMIAGSIDIGLIPASTYVLYQPDGVKLLLEALRFGVAGEDGNVIDPKDGIAPWNAGKTQDATGTATGYASLIYVNIDTEKGADLYAKAQAGTLTWDDVNSAKWYVCSSTSSGSLEVPKFGFTFVNKQKISILLNSILKSSFNTSTSLIKRIAL